MDRLHRGNNQILVVIANYIYDNPTALDLDLQGVWIADRKLGRPKVNANLTLVPKRCCHTRLSRQKFLLWISFTSMRMSLRSSVSDSSPPNPPW